MQPTCGEDPTHKAAKLDPVFNLPLPAGLFPTLTSSWKMLICVLLVCSSSVSTFRVNMTQVGRLLLTERAAIRGVSLSWAARSSGLRDSDLESRSMAMNTWRKAERTVQVLGVTLPIVIGSDRLKAAFLDTMTNSSGF